MNFLLHDTVFLSHLILIVSSTGHVALLPCLRNLAEIDTIPNMAVEEDEKEIPQVEKLVEETIAIDEEEKDDAEEEEG